MWWVLILCFSIVLFRWNLIWLSYTAASLLTILRTRPIKKKLKENMILDLKLGDVLILSYVVWEGREMSL